MSLIQPLSRELPYAAGEVLKRKKKKRKEKKKEKEMSLGKRYRRSGGKGEV